VIPSIPENYAAGFVVKREMLDSKEWVDILAKSGMNVKTTAHDDELLLDGKPGGSRKRRIVFENPNL